MRLNNKGEFIFDNLEDLTFNFLNSVGLSVLPDGYVTDTEISYNTINGRISGTPIQIGGKSLKANIDPNNIKYAGEGEIILDLFNIKMVTTILGLFLDKLRVFEGKEINSYYSEDIMDNNGNRLFNTVVNFANDEDVSSNYYYNKCLSYIEIMFIISDVNVDLKNFDIIEEQNESNNIKSNTRKSSK